MNTLKVDTIHVCPRLLVWNGDKEKAICLTNQVLTLDDCIGTMFLVFHFFLKLFLGFCWILAGRHIRGLPQDPAGVMWRRQVEAGVSHVVWLLGNSIILHPAFTIGPWHFTYTQDTFSLLYPLIKKQ